MVPVSYIIFESFDGIEFPVIFTSNVEHVDMARRMAPNRIKSAGKINLTLGSSGEPMLTCHGNSVSLGIEARSFDSDIINSWFKLDW